MELNDLSLNEIYEIEAEHSLLTGSRTGVFLSPQERSAHSPEGAVQKNVLGTEAVTWFRVETQKDQARLGARELVSDISKETGVVQQQVLQVVERTLDHIANAIEKGMAVDLRDFGDLEVTIRKAQASKNANKSETGAPTSSGVVTVIDVKHDVGFGNALFLRGQGGGLNWEHGVPLVCVDGKTWRWSGKVKDPLTFKLLINDKIWSAGNDITIKPGQKISLKPKFFKTKLA